MVLSAGPADKSPPCNARDSGSIPGQGTKIPHVAWPKKYKKPGVGKDKVGGWD